METPHFFGFELYNPQNYLDFLIRFSINLAVIYLLARRIYFNYRRNRDYLFTLLIFNIIVFFVCYLLNKVSLSIGFAFGIFAIFSILRYRTQTIPIKEMTYIFIAISIAIINALGNNIVGLLELLIANAVIVALVFALERVKIKSEFYKIIRYEKIDLIKPENYALLLEDLRQRTGLNIHRAEVGRVDFLRDTAQVRAYYYPAKSIRK